MAARKKNPLDDVAKTVGNWLGGAARAYADITDRSRDVQPGRLPQVQAALDATRAIGKVVDIATGGFGSAVVSDARRMAKTGSSTPSALYKTAAVNLGAAAVGVGAAKVAGKVVESGVAARAINKATGKQVIVHGSPVKGIRNLEPRTGGIFGPNVPQSYLYGLNPEAANVENLGEFAGNYARQGGRRAKLKVEGPGSVYVAKVQRGSVVNPQALGPGARLPIVTATGSAKVVREIPVAGLSDAALEKKILQAAKRAGAKVPKKK